MDEILSTLNDWLIWFENPGETVPPALVEKDALIGFSPRGFQSNRFICRFETEKAAFDVEMPMNDRTDEEDAAAIVKLAMITLSTPFQEKVTVSVSDELAYYNGGTLEDFLHLIDKLSAGASENRELFYP